MLQNARLLRECEQEELKNIYITPDMSMQSRQQNRELRQKIAVRAAQGEEHMVIRLGKIIQIGGKHGKPGTGNLGRSATTSNSGRSATTQQPPKESDQVRDETRAASDRAKGTAGGTHNELGGGDNAETGQPFRGAKHKTYLKRT